jgi:acetylornithine deacetylase
MSHDEALLRAALDGDPVALTRLLVQTPSVNPVLEAGGDGEAAIASLTAGWLETWGFEVTWLDRESGRPSVLARSRGATPGRTLLLNGHLDTVGVEGMSIDPFSGDLVDGRILGRGSCDMKAGVASLLAAARALRDEGHPGELVVALTSDEEHASLGMYAVIEAGVRADATVVCEPTSLAVMPANKGFMWVEADFRGRAAHGSRPDQGVDGIAHAGEYLAALSSLSVELETRSPHPLLGHGSFHAGTISGGSAPSVYPAECRLVLERRTLPGETDGEVMEEFRRVAEGLRKRVPDLDLTLSQGLTRPATEVPLDGALVRGLVEALEGEGLQSRIEGMTAWVDAALLNEAGTPALCFGPGTIGKAHSQDEWVPAEEVEACARVLTRFGRRFLAG